LSDRSGDQKQEVPKRYILGQELAEILSDGSELRQELLNAFFAGHDSPGIAMTSAFFSLSRHPEVWTNLRREVLERGTEHVDFEFLKSLKYMNWIINECKSSHLDHKRESVQQNKHFGSIPWSHRTRASAQQPHTFLAAEAHQVKPLSIFTPVTECR